MKQSDFLADHVVRMFNRESKIFVTGIDCSPICSPIRDTCSYKYILTDGIY